MTTYPHRLDDVHAVDHRPGMQTRTLIGTDHGVESFFIDELRMEEGAQVPLHTHPVEEAWVVTAGTLTLQVGDDTVNVDAECVLRIPLRSGKPDATKVETPPSPPASLVDISLEDYFSRLKAFSDRFLQRQEFINSLAGRTVSWQGCVGRVSEYSGSGRLSVTLTINSDSSLMVLVWLPSEFRTQAFSLRRGDLVRVTGTLGLSTPSMPDLAARELTMLAAS